MGDLIVRGRSQMTLVTFSVIVTQRGGKGHDTDHLFSAGSESFTANVL